MILMYNTIMNKIIKAVIYARVSSEEQKKQGFSIPAQLGDSLLENLYEDKGAGLEETNVRMFGT